MRTLRLIRRFHGASVLDFDPPRRCHCCEAPMAVRDLGRAFDESHYEVYCPGCGLCDVNGYPTQRAVIQAYQGKANT